MEQMLSVPFYDFPSSPLLIIGALGIVVALAVFFLSYQKYFNSPFNKELQQKKKSLLKESFFKRFKFLVRVNELHCSVKPLKLCSMETIFLLS